MKEFTAKPLRPRGAARRDALLKAAAEVFLESGYDKASLSEIIARAGGSKAMVYEQFGDKAGLFRAMMADRCAEILQPLNEDVPRPKDPAIALTSLGRRFIEVLCGPEALALQRVAVSEGHKNPDIANAYFITGHDVAYKKLADYLASIEKTKLDRSELLRLSVTFFAMIQGDAVQRRLVGSDTLPTQRELNAILALAVDWLLGKIGLTRANS
jgi:TetR/AcrR family transcriptional regulator, mexJK operon transcriptional repressor